MSACSTPLTVVIELVSGTSPIGLGEAATYRAKFTTNGAAIACTQTINFAATPSGGVPSSWDTQENAVEDTWYSKAFTPIAAGVYDVFPQLVYRENSEDLPNITLTGDAVTLRVIESAVDRREAEIIPDDHTVGVAGDAITVEIAEDDLTAGIAGDAVDLSVGEDSIGVGTDG